MGETTNRYFCRGFCGQHVGLPRRWDEIGGNELAADEGVLPRAGLFVSHLPIGRVPVPCISLLCCLKNENLLMKITFSKKPIGVFYLPRYF